MKYCIKFHIECRTSDKPVSEDLAEYYGDENEYREARLWFGDKDVIMIYPHSHAGTLIEVNGGDSMRVKETFEEISSAIFDVLKNN